MKGFLIVRKKEYDFMEIGTYQTHLILYFTELCASLKLAVETLSFLLRI